MSKLFDYREALKASIVAADIGWVANHIIIKRQTDLWNEVATAIASNSNGTVLHIGVASGRSTEEDELEMDVTIPLTILATPQLVEGATPEEDLWEALISHVHDLRLNDEAHLYRFKFSGFEDLEIEADNGTSYLGRQTNFTKRLSI